MPTIPFLLAIAATQSASCIYFVISCRSVSLNISPAMSFVMLKCKSSKMFDSWNSRRSTSQFWDFWNLALVYGTCLSCFTCDMTSFYYTEYDLESVAWFPPCSRWVDVDLMTWGTTQQERRETKGFPKKLCFPDDVNRMTSRQFGR